MIFMWNKGATGQYVSKKSENWYLGSLYIEKIGFRRPAHKKVFFIFRNTLLTAKDIMKKEE